MSTKAPARSHLGAFAVSATFLVACGSNNADVPPELIRAIHGSNNVEGYPAGPYGTKVGDTVQDLCFDGWRDPAAAGYDPARFERICLSDFYDAQGAEVKLLLVNSSALWCTACRYEYDGSQDRPPLSERLAQREAQGFRLLGTLFQDLQGKSAGPTHAATWAESYSIDFPFALDPDDQMGQFASSTIAPFNILIDTRTMHIVLELTGDSPAVLFGKVDDFLGKTGP